MRGLSAPLCLPSGLEPRFQRGDRLLGLVVLAGEKRVDNEEVVLPQNPRVPGEGERTLDTGCLGSAAVVGKRDALNGSGQPLQDRSFALVHLRSESLRFGKCQALLSLQILGYDLV